MSYSRTPVPSALLGDFTAHMRTAELQFESTGQWFDQLNTRAGDFLREHGLYGRPVDAVAQYIDVKQARTPGTHDA